jgi:Big-like domain-containing protein
MDPRPFFRLLPFHSAAGGRVKTGRLCALVLAAAALFAGCEKQPAAIKVKGPRDAVESQKMNPQFPPFEKKGDTIKLRASAFDKDGAFMGAARVKWDSSDRTVATVDGTGLVTILSSGDAQIRATGDGYAEPLEASLPIKAVIVDKVKIVPPDDKKIMHLGESKQFKAEVKDDRGHVIPDAKVHWRSSSFAATVTDTGEVEGRAIGTTQLVVEAEKALDRFDLEVLDWEKGKRPKGE